MSSHTSYAAVIQRSRKDNLTVLLLVAEVRWLRLKTLMAKEATKNSHPGDRTRVEISVGTSQVARDGTAAQDANKGLTQPGPAATAGLVQPRAKFFQPGINQIYREKSTHFGFKCRKCDWTILWLRDFGGH